MIQFLLKGILRDKNRSVLPIIIITIGVVLTITLSGFMRGVLGDIINENARFETGHVKVMTRAYAKNKDQLPNDLAILNTQQLTQQLEKQFPAVEWVERIRFGGLLDIPDTTGQSKGQGPATALAVALHSKPSGEITRLNITNSLVSGSIPTQKGQVLVGQIFAEKFNLKIGEEITYIGTTMNGSMTFQNFKVSGTIRFGSAAMDKGFLIMDIADARQLLDMENATGELLGYLKEGAYNDKKAVQMCDKFNVTYLTSKDEFAPIMLRLKEQNNLAGYIDYVDVTSSLFVAIFVFAMSIVLWNTGLLGGLRRYQEFGIRLALGEEKGHIYRTLLYEALLIGIIGSLMGTFIGLGIVYYLQTVGIDISSFLSNASMLMPTVLRAKFTPDLLYIGFIPGLFAMVLGNMLSGIGIYQRETATLFKELEV
ncbi:MAG: FtsX-like permease family protein [Spirosomataceae bacterium]